MAETQSRAIAAREKQEVSQQQERTRPGRFYIPQVNICEFEDSLKLWADMPGVKEKDVEVTLKDGTLTIIGKVATDMYSGSSPVYAEYRVGNYYREFALHEDIDASKISATMRNGVLELELPKKEQAKPQRIQVRGA